MDFPKFGLLALAALLVLYSFAPMAHAQLQTTEPLPILQVVKMGLVSSGKPFVLSGDLGGAMVSVDLSKVSDPLPSLRRLLNVHGLELVERSGVYGVEKYAAASVAVLPRLLMTSKIGGGKWSATFEGGYVVADGQTVEGVKMRVDERCATLGALKSCL